MSGRGAKHRHSRNNNNHNHNHNHSHNHSHNNHGSKKRNDDDQVYFKRIGTKDKKIQSYLADQVDKLGNRIKTKPEFQNDAHVMTPHQPFPFVEIKWHKTEISHNNGHGNNNHHNNSNNYHSNNQLLSEYSHLEVTREIYRLFAEKWKHDVIDIFISGLRKIATITLDINLTQLNSLNCGKNGLMFHTGADGVRVSEPTDLGQGIMSNGNGSTSGGSVSSQQISDLIHQLFDFTRSIHGTYCYNRRVIVVCNAPRNKHQQTQFQQYLMSNNKNNSNNNNNNNNNNNTGVHGLGGLSSKQLINAINDPSQPFYRSISLSIMGINVLIEKRHIAKWFVNKLKQYNDHPLLHKILEINKVELDYELLERKYKYPSRADIFLLNKQSIERVRHACWGLDKTLFNKVKFGIYFHNDTYALHQYVHTFKRAGEGTQIGIAISQPPSSMQSPEKLKQQQQQQHQQHQMNVNGVTSGMNTGMTNGSNGMTPMNFNHRELFQTGGNNNNNNGNNTTTNNNNNSNTHHHHQRYRPVTNGHGQQGQQNPQNQQNQQNNQQQVSHQSPSRDQSRQTQGRAQQQQQQQQQGQSQEQRSGSQHRARAPLVVITDDRVRNSGNNSPHKPMSAKVHRPQRVQPHYTLRRSQSQTQSPTLQRGIQQLRSPQSMFHFSNDSRNGGNSSNNNNNSSNISNNNMNNNNSRGSPIEVSSPPRQLQYQFDASQQLRARQMAPMTPQSRLQTRGQAMSPVGQVGQVAQVGQLGQAARVQVPEMRDIRSQSRELAVAGDNHQVQFQRQTQTSPEILKHGEASHPNLSDHNSNHNSSHQRSPAPSHRRGAHGTHQSTHTFEHGYVETGDEFEEDSICGASDYHNNGMNNGMNNHLNNPVQLQSPIYQRTNGTVQQQHSQQQQHIQVQTPNQSQGTTHRQTQGQFGVFSQQRHHQLQPVQQLQQLHQQRQPVTPVVQTQTQQFQSVQSVQGVQGTQPIRNFHMAQQLQQQQQQKQQQQRQSLVDFCEQLQVSGPNFLAGFTPPIPGASVPVGLIPSVPDMPSVGVQVDQVDQIDGVGGGDERRIRRGGAGGAGGQTNGGSGTHSGSGGNSGNNEDFDDYINPMTVALPKLQFNNSNDSNNNSQSNESIGRSFPPYLTSSRSRSMTLSNSNDMHRCNAVGGVSTGVPSGLASGLASGIPSGIVSGAATNSNGASQGITQNNSHSASVAAVNGYLQTRQYQQRLGQQGQQRQGQGQEQVQQGQQRRGGASAFEHPTPRNEFYRFWYNVIDLAEYVSAFDNAQYSDLRIVKQCDRDDLVNKIGINDRLHLKFIMDELNKLRVINQQFRDWLGYNENDINCGKYNTNNNDFARYCVTFENCGILTFNQLGYYIRESGDFSKYFNIHNPGHCEILYSQLKKYRS